MDFFIICVLYNKKINDINSLDTFKRFKGTNEHIRIMIFDNSTDEEIIQKNKLYSDDLIEYFCNNGNLGLSKVYNLGLEKVKIQSSTYAIMLADDDTDFSIDYLKNAYNEIQKEEVHVVAGIVYSNDCIMSPKLSISKNEFVNEPGVYKHIYAINSGIVFDDYVTSVLGQFDESLFLDMIDYWFAKKVDQFGIVETSVVEGRINQNFSGTTKTDLKAERKRYAIYSKDVKAFMKVFPEEAKTMRKILIKRWFNINIMHRLIK